MNGPEEKGASRSIEDAFSWLVNDAFKHDILMINPDPHCAKIIHCVFFLDPETYPYTSPF